MKVGIEGNHILDCRAIGVYGVLDEAKRLGLGGVFFKTVLDLSPSLDPGELRAVRAYADDLGLELNLGLGRVNPYNTPESPEIRVLGDGDYRRGFERMIAACVAISCRELLVGTGTWKPFPGRFAFDRFRSDAPWPEQLRATQLFLASLAPFLRAHGCRLNIETHEEITSFEVVRLVERVDPEVLGVTFDTANVISRAEDPVAAAHRVAPYVHLMHAKDAILFFDGATLVRQPRPCGDGVVDWATILPILWAHSPDLLLSIEDHTGRQVLEIDEPDWLAAHPDVTRQELDALMRMARSCEERVARHEIPDPDSYDLLPWEAHKFERLDRSRRHLDSVIASQGLVDQGVRV